MELLRRRHFSATLPVIVVVVMMVHRTVDAINIKQGPTAQLVRPGATVTFTCDVDQKRGTTLYWYRMEQSQYLSHDRAIYTRLHPDQRRRLSIIGDRNMDVFTLRIANVQRSDDGTYQCGYADGLGRLNVLGSAKLTVYIEPSAESPMCSISVVHGDPTNRRVGDTVDMRCETRDGNPIPDLVWFRGREELEENEGQLAAVHRQLLTAADAYINYTCVMRGPLITTRRACSIRPVEVPPVLHIDPAVNSAFVGSTAAFACSMITTNGLTVGVRSYTWQVNATADRVAWDSPERITLTQNRQVLEIRDLQLGDDNMPVTCTVQTTTGEIFTGTARLTVVVEPPPPTTGAPEMTTLAGDIGGAIDTEGTIWHRALRPTHRGFLGTEMTDASDYDNDEAVTVGMKPKIPAFLTGRTFIMTSAAVGAFLIVIVIVIIIVVKIMRRRTGKRLPITTPVLVAEHGNDPSYATVLEMKRQSGSTYRGAATLPGLKADRKIGIPEVMRGGSSLSLTARNACLKETDTERSPLYAKPDRLRNSKGSLFTESKKNSLIDNAEENEDEPDVGRGMTTRSTASTLSANRDLNAEGLIYADLVLGGDSKANNFDDKKGTQYASIFRSEKPSSSL